MLVMSGCNLLHEADVVDTLMEEGKLEEKQRRRDAKTLHVGQSYI